MFFLRQKEERKQKGREGEMEVGGRKGNREGGRDTHIEASRHREREIELVCCLLFCQQHPHPVSLNMRLSTIAVVRDSPQIGCRKG